MIKLERISKFLLLLPPLFLMLCVPDASHDNPLDPSNNPDYNQIRGYAYSYYSPHKPLADVQIALKPAELFCTTGDDGHFLFKHLQPGQYNLKTSKEAFQTTSVQIEFSGYQSEKSVDLFINALPVIKKVNLYSEHIDQWWPGEIYQLQMNAIISDMDGISDIDSVACSIPGMAFYKIFNFTEKPDSFYISIDDFDLPGGSLYSVCAESCYIRVTDKATADTAYGPFFLHRIIEGSPTPISPTSMQIVTGNPVFEWQRISLPYLYYQEIQLYQLFPGGLVLIDTIKPIDPQITSYVYTKKLQAGNYVWAIGIRDESFNFSRSKEASFIIE